MTERPILFSAPMVRALLDGTKTQTRRIVKPARQLCPYGVPGDLLWVRESGKIVRDAYDHDPATGKDLWRDVGWVHAADEVLVQRETLATALAPLSDWIGDCALIGRPSIHMPRWASRINLQITDVRVERLNDCTEADALAEGVVWSDRWQAFVVPGVEHPNKDFPVLSRATAREMYAALWDTINGSGEWLGNPWVWVVSFERA